MDHDGQYEELLRFYRRMEAGGISREVNPFHHFCVYTAVFDPQAKEVFIGHHKKSDLWLFMGGHIEPGETPTEAVVREVGEELGNVAIVVGIPNLLTISQIVKLTPKELRDDTPRCFMHYDIWYFLAVEKASFSTDQSLLATEFHSTKWLAYDEAEKRITDENNLLAIQKMREFDSTV